MRNVVSGLFLVLLAASYAPAEDAPAEDAPAKDAPALEPAKAARPSVQVTIDPRVELMSILFFLAGNPEYNQARVPGYLAAVEQHFRPYAGHPAVAYAKRLRTTRGVSYDAVMALALHLTDVESMQTVVALDPRPAGLDARWHPAEARTFLGLVRDFVRETGFLAWFAGHKANHEEVTARMRVVLQAHARLSWVDAFFGVPPKSSFTLTLGLLNGGRCYGPRVVQRDGREDIHCVLGVWLVDEQGEPRFDKTVLPVVVHEFCHSYCNPLVDAHATDLAPVGLRLWPRVADRMKRQAYADWKTMLYESLVRASVVRYLVSVEGERAGQVQAQADKDLGFLWIDELAASLATYEQRRAEYPSLGDYLATLRQVLETFADKLEQVEASRPKVLSMSPANGAAHVDPALTSLRVTFDRPMRAGGWSFVGGGPGFPKVTGEPVFNEARTILTLPIQLRPAWDYAFRLNGGRFQAFQSEAGVPLASVSVKFRTRKAP